MHRQKSSKSQSWQFLRGQANLRQKAGIMTTFQMYRRYTYDSLLERDGRPVNDPVFFLVYFYVYKKIHTFKNHGYRSKQECVVHFEATFWTSLSPVPWCTVWLPERIEILYPCTRLQHSPRSFPTYITTVVIHRELFWSLHFHFTTMLKRQPNWDPTTDGVLVFGPWTEC
jgi:hypothetical protein